MSNTQRPKGNTPKFTFVIPNTLTRHYRAEAVREGRSLSDVIRRALFRDSGVPRDPEATALKKTPKLPGMP